VIISPAKNNHTRWKNHLQFFFWWSNTIWYVHLYLWLDQSVPKKKAISCQPSWHLEFLKLSRDWSISDMTHPSRKKAISCQPSWHRTSESVTLLFYTYLWHDSPIEKKKNRPSIVGPHNICSTSETVAWLIYIGHGSSIERNKKDVELSALMTSSTWNRHMTHSFIFVTRLSHRNQNKKT